MNASLDLTGLRASAELVAMLDPNLRFIDLALEARPEDLSSLASEDLHDVLMSLDDGETDAGGAGSPPRRRPPVAAAAPAAPPGGRGPKKKRPLWWEVH